MAIRKKIIKAEDGVKIENINQTPYRKFKMGSRDIDLTDEFMKGLEDELISTGVQGQGVTDIMSRIKSGDIYGINEGGDFYGKDLDNYSKSTRRNRVWNIGKKDIIDVQNAAPGVTNAIRSVYSKLNQPVPQQPLKEINLSNDARNIRKYGYHGNDIDDNTWNSMDIKTRLDTYGNALEGYGKEFLSLGDYDEKIHKGINKQTYDLLRTRGGELGNKWRELSAKWLANDGNIDTNELNEFYTEYGINGSDLFGGKLLTEAEQAEKDRIDAENKKLEDDKRQDGINAIKSKFGEGDWRYDGSEKDDLETMNNPDKWRIYEGDSPMTRYIAERNGLPGDTNINSGVYYEGKRIGDNFDNLQNPYEHLGSTNTQYQDFVNKMYKMRQDFDKQYTSVGPTESRLGLGHVFGKDKVINMTNQFPEYSGNLEIYSVNEGGVPKLYTITNNGDKHPIELKEENGKRYFINPKTGEKEILGVYIQDDEKLNTKISGDKGWKPGWLENANNLLHEINPAILLGNTLGVTNYQKSAPIDWYGLTPGGIYERLRSNKKGGTLDFNKINKFQFGGRINLPEVKSDEEIRNAQYQENTRSGKVKEVLGSEYQLKDYDKADLVGLTMDLGGLIAGFVPGGNMVSAGLGVGSTLTSLYSDVRRDGLDLGDVGSFAMNLGMDAASAIPFAGNLAKTSKILKTLKKGEKALTLAMTTAGLTQGVVGLSNVISKGKDATIDDYKMLMSGLQGLAGGVKGGIKKVATKNDINSVSLKLGDKDIKFKNEADAKAFADKYKGVQAKEASLKGLEGDAKVKAEGELSTMKNSLKEEYPNIELSGDLATKMSKGLTWKGFGKHSPVGLKEGELKMKIEKTPSYYQNGEGGYWNQKASKYMQKIEGATLPNKISPVDIDYSPRTYLGGTSNKFRFSNKGLTPSEIKQVNFVNSLNNSIPGIPKTVKKPIMLNAADPRDINIRNNEAKLNEILESRNVNSNSTNNNPILLKSGKEKLAEEINKIRILREGRRNHYSKIQEARNQVDINNSIKENKESEEMKKRVKEGMNLLTPGKGKNTKAKSNKNTKVEKNSQDTNSTLTKKQVNQNIKNDSKIATKKRKNERKEANRERGKFKEGGIIPKYQNPFGSLQLKTPSLSIAPKNEFNIGQGLDINKKVGKFDHLMDPLNTTNFKNTPTTFSKAGLYNDPTYLNITRNRALNEIKNIENSQLSGTGVINTGDNNQEIGSALNKVKSGLSSALSPANVRFASTLIGNQKMMDLIKKSPRPTNASPINFNRLKNIGLGQIQPQISEVNQMVNSQQDVYSDAKLNAAMRLAQNSEASKMKQGLHSQLANQNNQIDSQNAQIGQQETLQNAQIAQSNAAKQDAHKQWLLSNKLGLTNSNYGAFANRMMEVENKNRMREQQLQALKDQKLMSDHNTEYQNAYDSFQNQWNEKAKASGKSWSDYYGSMSDVDRNAYIKAKNKLMSNSQNQLLDKRIAELNNPLFFASGGKMTLQEKKELETLKADKKKQLESNKAFNKLMLEKSKSHDKMLSLLSKDMKATVKNILKK